jgi:lysophospholipase L1-like esterase
VIRAVAAMACLATAGPATAQERPWTPLPGPISATCPGGLCQPQGLQGFFRALARQGPVRIVQFGDSHTAGGDITDGLLSRLQARFRGRDVRLDASGVVGDTLRGLAAREPLLTTDASQPDLVILAYGTNEGFDDLLDPVAYERLLRDQIGRVRRSAPEASILVLGAPEAMRGEGGGTCPDDPEARWRAPAMLAVVRDVQHRVAAETGVAFWDWRGRMGGDCSAHALTLGVEPLMRGDHVHFTRAGGDWIGSLLFADIAAAHARGGR